jgi:CRP-like cAMP-binding protein
MAAAGIHLFEADPDLLNAVPDEERERAVRTTVVRVRQLAAGPWDPRLEDAPRWGMLVLEGVMARRLRMVTATAAELLGIGDLVLCDRSGTGDAIVVREVTWTVLEPARLALLDDRLAPALAHWPGLAACLLERAERRACRLAVTQAISHLTRIDTRILALLWVLADRWGRVGSDGIVLPLALTHRTIAQLVGARRPSVTTALTHLGRRGLIERREDGAWLLNGPPPAELAQAGVEPEPPPALAPRRTVSNNIDPATARTELTARVARLLAGYEAQTARARALLAEAEAIRESSQTLRDQAIARRAGE